MHNTDPFSETGRLLQSLTEQAARLDEGALQEHINRLSLGLQELNRQMQLRQFALQIKQMQAQRENEQQGGGGAINIWSGDKEIADVLRSMENGIGGIGEQDLHEDINRLNAEIQELNRQMQERQYALQLKQMAAQREQEGANSGIGLWMTVGSSHAQVGAGAGEQVDSDAKREAILDAMAKQPNRLWKPAQMVQALIEHGIGDPDAGTPIRNLMWRMAKDGALERPRTGLYRLTPTEPSDDDDQDSL